VAFPGLCARVRLRSPVITREQETIKIIHRHRIPSTHFNKTERKNRGSLRSIQFVHNSTESEAQHKSVFAASFQLKHQTFR
jgi:hypothetical protein